MIGIERCIVVLLRIMVFVGGTWAADYTEINDSLFACPQLKSQESLDLDEIMGKWYVVEVLDHKIEPTRPMSMVKVVVDTCPIIKLKPDGRAVLRLLWTEGVGDLEYTFKFPDSARGPGYWLSNVPQNGTLAVDTYLQFAGTVHVMKAVGNHMVLTFCGASPNYQLYSVLVSREHILRTSNVKGVHDLLTRRHLKIVSIRQTCAKGSASAATASLLVFVLSRFVIILRPSFR